MISNQDTARQPAGLREGLVDIKEMLETKEGRRALLNEIRPQSRAAKVGLIGAFGAAVAFVVSLYVLDLEDDRREAQRIAINTAFDNHSVPVEKRGITLEAVNRGQCDELKNYAMACHAARDAARSLQP